MEIKIKKEGKGLSLCWEKGATEGFGLPAIRNPRIHTINQYEPLYRDRTVDILVCILNPVLS